MGIILLTGVITKLSAKGHKLYQLTHFYTNTTMSNNCQSVSIIPQIINCTQPVSHKTQTNSLPVLEKHEVTQGNMRGSQASSM